MAASFPTNQAIVVGGGLGGMSAANTVVENGGRVILLATWVRAGEVTVDDKKPCLS
jgi:predicted flavoprotein YhiN